MLGELGKALRFQKMNPKYARPSNKEQDLVNLARRLTASADHVLFILLFVVSAS